MDWCDGARTGAGAGENGQSKEPGWAVHAEVQEESQNGLRWKGP